MVKRGFTPTPNNRASLLKYNKNGLVWGFTMIELLVVISIIGILAAMVTVSFTSSQRQARDTERKSDLSQYRTQLESYANRNNGLYTASAASIGMSTLCSSNYLDLSSSTTCPLDPADPTITYRYCTDGAVSDGTPVATKYVLWASLENVTSTYWTVCSDGRTGTSVTAPACAGSFNCNLP